jgi:hypothetical protein
MKKLNQEQYFLFLQIWSGTVFVYDETKSTYQFLIDNGYVGRGGNIYQITSGARFRLERVLTKYKVNNMRLTDAVEAVINNDALELFNNNNVII